MSNEQHYRKLERMYLGAPINDYFKPEIRIGEGWAEVIVPVRKDYFHAAEAVHGAVYFKALDDATFFAASSLVEEYFLLTISFNLYFTRPIADGQMKAMAKVVQNSRRLLIAEGELVDGRDRLIARGSGAFMRSEVPLSRELGYK